MNTKNKLKDMAKNNTNKIFSQETAEQHGFEPAYALNDGTDTEVWVRRKGINKQYIFVKPSPKMKTDADYAFDNNGERTYINPKGKKPVFPSTNKVKLSENELKQIVEESVRNVLEELDLTDPNTWITPQDKLNGMGYDENGMRRGKKYYDHLLNPNFRFNKDNRYGAIDYLTKSDKNIEADIANREKRQKDADDRWDKSSDNRPLHRKGSLNRDF